MKCVKLVFFMSAVDVVGAHRGHTVTVHCLYIIITTQYISLLKRTYF